MRLIDGDALKERYENHRKLYCKNRIEFKLLSEKDKARVDELDNCIADILNAPTIEPDLSSYSDKLWRNAYERGRAEAEAEIVRCKDCKWFYEDKWCVRYMYALLPEDFCSYAERRQDG